MSRDAIHKLELLEIFPFVKKGVSLNVENLMKRFRQFGPDLRMIYPSDLTSGIRDLLK